MAKQKILIVEDEAVTALDLKSELSDLGYEVVAIADNAQDAIREADRLKPNLVLMDIHLPGGIDGILAATVIRANEDIPVVFLTAHSDDMTLDRALSAAPFGYVLKPFLVRELKVTIELALYKHHKDLEMRQQLNDLESKASRLSGLISICSACKNIRDNDGSWVAVEEYIQRCADVEFTHGICPVCEPKYYHRPSSSS